QLAAVGRASCGIVHGAATVGPLDSGAPAAYVGSESSDQRLHGLAQDLGRSLDSLLERRGRSAHARRILPRSRLAREACPAQFAAARRDTDGPPVGRADAHVIALQTAE